MARIRQLSSGDLRGSALILTVVLTSLLAILGVLFLMAARIDKMASSATADNRELAFAIDSVLARIGEELAEDVPGRVGGPEYYDYPDANDPWLADLEPYSGDPSDPNAFFWRQISDVTGRLAPDDRNDVAVDPPDRRTVIEEYARSDLVGEGQWADADGDGIADSKWVQWDRLMSTKGRPIYAAVRIVDNGGMLNVNTGYQFDPDPNHLWMHEMDGHTQLHVNLLLLGGTGDDLLKARANNPAGPVPPDLDRYEREVIWQYGPPASFWTPFDLSDELELRYRYCINSEKIGTRVENLWTALASAGPTVPYDASSGRGLTNWCARILDAVAGDRRHLLTTYNMDRIITPGPVSLGLGTDPNRMININTADEYAISQGIAAALGDVDLGRDPALIVANIRDYIDDDSQVTVVPGATATSPAGGFEQPCIYISELAYRSVRDPVSNRVDGSFAVELCKPYFEDADPAPGEWQLVIDNQTVTDVTESIAWSGTRRFHVLLAENSRASLSGTLEFNDPSPTEVVPGYDPALYRAPVAQRLDAAGFSEGATIELQRKVVDGGVDKWVRVDRVTVPGGWMPEDGVSRSLERDIRQGKCILGLWESVHADLSDPNFTPTLGYANQFTSTDPRNVQAHPANRPLRNIGELGMILARSAYDMPEGLQPTDILIDLKNPVYANLFNYFTVMDPAAHLAGPDETRIKGRVNINTAPAFVLAQLPWMMYRCNPNTHRVEYSLDRAKAIVGYRNVQGAFRSTAGLMQIPQMWELDSDLVGNQFGDKLLYGPDVTPDSVIDDLEERDLIFTRVSDLVTVRSDVFTAYILVRIGADGPQKRVVAVLDRSQVRSSRDPVRVVALQQVPDPR
jgi:hypothetical protein